MKTNYKIMNWVPEGSNFIYQHNFIGLHQVSNYGFYYRPNVEDKHDTCVVLFKIKYKN